MKLKNIIEELGFKEEIDYNGKMVLKNNVPIKKNMHYWEVESLLDRLKDKKKGQKQGKENTDSSMLKQSRRGN